MNPITIERLGVVLEPKGRETRTIATFNAGMTFDGTVVHMVYRHAEWRKEFDYSIQSNYAVDETRYAQLSPDGKLVRDFGRALLKPSLPWDSSGCQDARVIPFEGAYYLVYCGWDKDTAPEGKSRPRVGFARTKDFQSCEKLGIIGHYAGDKDAFIFPERIGGKIAYVHRVLPNIQLDYFDSWEALLDQKFWDAYDVKACARSTLMEGKYPWENAKVGGSIPPIKTARGWLFIYHGVQRNPKEGEAAIYRAGAALLDLENPSRVIARLPYPILEPETEYERVGDVNNVVFPVGGYVHNGYLYMSYGGADRCVAMARTPLDALLAELMRHPV